jgi:Family of unknown function (DUF5677)
MDDLLDEKTLQLVRDRYIDAMIGQKVFPAVTSIPPESNPLAIVSSFFLQKATKTIDAVCILLETGFVEDAQILGRTIFELAVHLNWIAKPETEDERRIRATNFIYEGERRRGEKLEELDRLKASGKCVSWIENLGAIGSLEQSTEIPSGFCRPPKLKEMVTELEGEWESWYYILYFSISTLVHPMAIGSHTYFPEANDNKQNFAALIYGLGMHILITKAVLNLNDLHLLHSEFEETVSALMKEIAPPT